MERVVVAAVLVIVAVGVAAVINRRRPDPPTQGSPVRTLPQQLDRADFEGSGISWLAVVFTSDTCDVCSSVVDVVSELRAEDLHVAEISWQDRRDLHDRYGVDTVPATVIADASGVVEAGFVGPMPPTELADAVAAARSRASR